MAALRYGIVLVLLLLFCLLLRAPATLLPQLLHRLSGGHAGLDVVGGTLWEGRASELRWRQLVLARDFSWQVKPLSLLLGSLRLKLQLAGRGAQIDIRPSSLRLQAERLLLPLSLLGELNQSLATYQLRGNAELHSDGFEFRRDQGDGRLQIRLLEAGSGLVAVPVLGDYRLQLAALRRGYRFDVTTERGVLRVSGDGRWTPGEGGAVRLQLHPEAQNEALRPLLSIAGRPSANGDYFLSTSFR